MGSLRLHIENKKSKQELRNIFLYSIAKTVSLFGSSIYSFALGLYVLQITGSALNFAITLILGTIPMIVLNPFAGVIADKVNKKKLVVCMDLLSGGLLITVYILSSSYGLNLFIIYTTTFLMTLFTTFFGIGLEAAKPNMVSKERLMSINAISKIIDSVSLILGPMLGGIVFAVLDIKIFIIINGISYILSAIFIFFINFKSFEQNISEECSIREIHFIKDIKEGYSYLMERKSLKNTFSILISLNFFLGFTVIVPLPYILNSVLNLSSKQFGIIQGTFSIGMIVGAVLVKKITDRFPYSYLLKKISFILGIFMIALGIPVLFQTIEVNNLVYVTLYCIIMFFLGLMIAQIDIPLMYFMQNEIPDEYRGRVLSIGLSIGKIIQPVALAISGLLLNYIPAYMLPIAGGIVFFILNQVFTNKLNLEIHSKDFSV
ncbi:MULTISPECIES: MFS transporter [Bacillus]|uniref:MFS transporter n=1 Tax=Bacillus thuringiensis serovar sooncheon TaxID=180891 RepID=A0A9Q5SJZ1_BACTU|nr:MULTISPECIES: MFS transporter [Bacillus]MCP1163844.1 MFS transporter [Bacillus sp. 1813sda1]OTW71570.1 MFS transporter [Bacillus thuringiensis serovar coreanensis]OTX55190.1 MFS transporter [Bacillus thuringiensis serovar sooncheon]OTX58527.1 MFS transporter [Bacillus thuringiensis serovar guiyangiensis]OTX72842.1 MFS transporter [Bacillus thuringiensis serovar roskildiensis]